MFHMSVKDREFVAKGHYMIIDGVAIDWVKVGFMGRGDANVFDGPPISAYLWLQDFGLTAKQASRMVEEAVRFASLRN